MSSGNRRVPSLIEVLQARARDDDRLFTFLLDGEDEALHLSGSELERRARSLGVKLRSMTAPGARALLLHPPGFDYIAAYFGCLFAGVIAVPAYPPDPQRVERMLPRLRRIVRDADVGVVLTLGGVLAMRDAIRAEAPELASLPWVASDELEPGLETSWTHPGVEGDTIAFLQYTSGSTAEPKGVMVTHGNLMANLGYEKLRTELTPEGTWVSWLPPYHDMGLIGAILLPLFSGAHAVLMAPGDFLRRPLRWLRAISRARGTHTTAPNFAYDLCVAKTTPEERETLDLSSWTAALNGAEPVRLETMRRFAAAFAGCGFRSEAFTPCYGLAEATLMVSMASRSRPPTHKRLNAAALMRGRVRDAVEGGPRTQVVVSCGPPNPGERVVICDPQSRTRCTASEIGEIWVSGPSVGLGYWRRPEETSMVFGARIAGGGEGRFLRTGDLGFIHQGQLYVTGRMNDMIIIRGRNYFPQDIEETVGRCAPGLRPGCSAAFACEMDGRECLAVVQEVDDAWRGDAADLLASIRAAVAREHRLRAAAVVLVRARTIPKTTSGKIQRSACRNAFASGELEVVVESRAGADEPATPGGTGAERVVDWLQSWVAAYVGVERREIDSSRPLVEFGLDSVAATELATELEARYDVDLPSDDALGELSVAALVELIGAAVERPER